MTPQPTTPRACPVEGPWKMCATDVLARLGVEATIGLSSSEAKKRLADYGPNRLVERKPRSRWLILLAQVRSLLVGLLFVGAVLSMVFRQWVEGGAIFAVIVINTLIGYFTELNAVRSMEALRRMGQVIVTVRRDGQLVRIAADQLVPGDITIVDGGDVVAADVRLFEANKLSVNESSLTGESVPVGKHVNALDGDSIVSDRKNMLFKGTSITRGTAEGVVVATGLDSELGRISKLVAEATEEITPLERRLEELGRTLVWVTLAVAPLVAATGWFAGKPLLLLVETAIALAVATVPEGLPIIATIALARAMHRLAAKNVLVNRLSAVETLGATSVICTDKTGTLTENRMTVRRILAPGGDVLIDEEGAGQIAPGDAVALEAALATGALCNNASFSGSGGVGDPLEVALLEAAHRCGTDKAALLAAMPELVEHAFDPERKRMATVHSDGDGYRIAVKGAPESVLAISSHELVAGTATELTAERRAEWEARCETAASHGFRLIGLADRIVSDPSVAPYEDLTWLGAAALWDPPRGDVAPAIAACKRAGIEIVMVTGDHPATARSVATAVGILPPPAVAQGSGVGAGAVAAASEVEVAPGTLLDNAADLNAESQRKLAQVRVFARVSPRQKLELIGLHQRQRAVVAMTGDGVNDAPALRKADIGVAMGVRGTDVAKQAAEMVLEDDSFASIAVAVSAGRSIFDNIRRFVVYLLSCNLSEVLVVTIAAVFGAPLPLLPLQILFLNLVTDVFPALALGVGPAAANVMGRAPRPFDESIVSPRLWKRIIAFAAVLTASVLGVFALALTVFEMPIKEAVTVAFLALSIGQLVHVFNMRSASSEVFVNEITRNRWVWRAIGLCVVLLAAALYVPLLAAVLSISPPSVLGWELVAAATIATLAGGQLVLRITGEPAQTGGAKGAPVSN